MTTAILITEAFPLGGLTEEAFVLPELSALSGEFDRVVVMPLVERGAAAPGLPSNVEVARDLVDATEWRHKWLRPLVHPLSATSPYRLAAATFESALNRVIRRYGLTPCDTVVECFWFDFPTTALARLRRRRGFRFVVRAHRYDIFISKAHRLRSRAIAMSEGVYAVSDAGAESLRERFSAEAERISTAYLGVPVSQKLASHSPEGSRSLRILTVARATEIKRPGLCIDMAEAIAVARPDWHIEWTFIGDGPEFENLRRRADSNRRNNLTISLPGAMPHRAVMDYYATHETDWFMLLSTSEGLPVSILEAMSLGVPVIATDVGGVSEAVDDETGLLLPVDVEKEEFVRGLVPYLDSKFRYDALCEGAVRAVKDRFDASDLRADFANKLKSLIES